MKLYAMWVFLFFVCCNLYVKSEYFFIQDGQSLHKNSLYVGKVIERSEHWNLRKGGSFYPESSGTMLQVKASGVIVDFGNYAVENKDSKENLITAVEVGYSKAELEANPDLQQISNVVIKNGCFLNFDVGIIVHKGVNKITIENCNFEGVSQGIVFLGTGSDKSESIIRVFLKNCTIIGHGENKQTKLVRLKQYIEGNSIQKGECAYGADVFMPLINDIIAQNQYNDVHAYAGIIAHSVYSFELDNIQIQNIGYHDYNNQSEGTGKRTASTGIFCKHCADVSIKNSTIHSCASEVTAVGIKIDATRNAHIENTNCAYQKSACKAYSIEVVDDSSYEDRFSLREKVVTFKNVMCESNVVEKSNFVSNSPEITSGLYVDGLYSIYADKLYCIGNIGQKKSYGICLQNVVNSIFENSLCNNNKSNGTIEANVQYGVVACGCIVQKSENIFFKSCDFSHNFGKNTGIGSFIIDSQNIEFKDSNFVGNKGAEYQQNELATTTILGSIRNLQDNQEISAYGPVVSATSTGGYGFIAKDCQRLGLCECKAQNNMGHRAIGFLYKDCNLITIDRVASLYQYGYGKFIHNDIKSQNQGGTVSNDYEIPILDVHRQLLFDNIFSEKFIENSLNIREYTKKFLTALEAVRSGWKSEVFISLDIERGIVKTLSLLFSLVARFRLWGIAFGVQIYNCSAVLVKNSEFSGQISEQDSGSGFVVTGNSSSIYIEHCDFSYNVGWRESKKTDMPMSYSYRAKYNLSAIKPFWEMVFSKFDKVNNHVKSGFFVQDETLIAQGQKEFDGSGDDITVTVDKLEQTFANVIAPVSAGLVLGDYCYSGTLSYNKFHANKGNAGYCAGLMLHIGENFLVEDNIIDDNTANIYGHCCGLIDMNLYSQNNYLRNRLSVNSVDGFYNSNSLIVADTRGNLSAVYPMVKLNNGIVINKVPEIDNIEINLPRVSEKEKKDSKKEKNITGSILGLF